MTLSSEETRQGLTGGSQEVAAGGRTVRHSLPPARPVVTRTTGVLVIDVSRHQYRGFCSPNPQRLNLPIGESYPPGTNVRLLIGSCYDVLPDDYGIRVLAQALRGCTVVVEGGELSGIHAMQAAIEGYRSFPDDDIYGGSDD